MSRKVLLFFVLGFVVYNMNSQGVFPVYTDYLSDNVFLVHPSAAGIGNCDKLRITYRRQWSGVSDAPSLGTMSYHTRIKEKVGLGGVIFNDENGFHAQKGISGTFAYHLNFGREDALDQLSMSLSFMYVQNTIDQTGFNSPIGDPIISKIIESESYYNADFSMAYHFLDFFSYFTVKNMFTQIKNVDNPDFQSLNLRRYLLTFGYYLGRNNSVQFEPSIMGQFIESTGEIFVDFNFKIYKNIGTTAQLWAVLSYRNSFEGNTVESLKQITPIIGINYKRFMFAYTYTYQLGEVAFDSGGFNQFTLGFNFSCKEQRSTGCPNVNSLF
jgi:type IX secretion system PorP/SprF family membrane protein